ncbi:YeiH family protein [Arthrobacter sp. SDTb3-6]|uniref:YeiH family protein n=1 Tax=Arthrobacter sp. SDTb3-6 TaxID=2713571 RepID=UPI00159E3D5E|nr:putative sulfate exporter family transporter [Arthrobacter sp. SDTb3-6]NVM99912.1 putative sulfate exporter family transporter [Arthrobacter sp. SDTb3-6]
MTTKELPSGPATRPPSTTHTGRRLGAFLRSWGPARWKLLAPGVAVCAAAAAAAVGLTALLPGASTLLIAIVIGVLLRNLVPVPARLLPGFGYAAKTLLRAGVVLLGYQLLVSDVLSLGPGMILVVVCIVGLGIGGTLLMGRWLGVGPTQRLLIACGFSICGAAAVAAVDGVIETRERREVMTAVALVVIFGTLMIPILPAAAALLGLGNYQAGLWAGGSIHEVAQVVAAGGTIGGAALGVAVIVKLARVLMLAPVMAVISVQRRRAMGASATSRKPPIMPLFVACFIAMMALRATGWLPGAALDWSKAGESFLLAAAMFALGTGVHVKSLLGVGLRPFILAAAATVWVACLALAGVLIFG